MSGHIKMNEYERECFKKALDLNSQAITYSKELREGSFKSRDHMIEKFSSTWSTYEDLFAILKNLLSNSKDELHGYFRMCYDSYMNDYNLLKGDMTNLLMKTANTAPLRPRDSSEEKIIQDLVNDITSFEKTSLEMLESGKPEKIRAYFTELNNRYLELFRFLKSIFEVSDKQPNFTFFLTPSIRVSW